MKSDLAALIPADGVLKAKLEWDVLLGNTARNSETDLRSPRSLLVDA